ncbi:major pollen allergen Ole e 10-like [Asparagus officinalis]|uniref:major pollen allergen Ole e 10-like n=1 Tax=Asparagus officinalis TaxID=4686 RepID=UPI00098E5011|nr:major pollen allergen Ole e 10-like [Asparagus officinalis]XP_020269741.1 major pollen allergen Ole e 10-like [Asparagus officinalis]
MARGVTALPSLSLISAALILLLFTSGSTVTSAQSQKTWCVAKPSSDEATLLANINYACSQVDCGILQKGSNCYYPDTLMSHASIAMNLYYQASGRNSPPCHFKDSALVVATNPSFGSCAYA